MFCYVFWHLHRQSLSQVFDYNRENYNFDNEQRIDKEKTRLAMQVERFSLFREDIEDLVKLTVSKMDM